MSYSVLMTAYNEEKLISKSIESILKQTIPPVCILIVNDGSTDKTENIINNYRIDTIKINENKLYLSSFNMVRALNRGYKQIKTLKFDYMLKIDADSEIPRDYVERLITIMQNNLRLGIVSGNISGMKIWGHRCSDGARLYRRKCFDEIGGLSFIVHWDTHALLKAYYFGWLVRTVYSIEYTEMRSHERQTWFDWYVSGIARYYHGFPIYHTFFTACIRVLNPPILGSLIMLISHIITSISTDIDNDNYRTFVKTFSKMELKHRLGKKLKKY